MNTANLLSAVAATGAGSSVLASPWNSNHAMQITITGAPTAVTVDLEGSLDGTTWVALVSHVMSAGELAASKALVFVTGAPVPMVRGNLTTLTGGTTPTVTVKYGQEA